ncbi:MAG: hypothetical protein ABSC54_00895 [Smithellaceae bacterium]
MINRIQKTMLGLIIVLMIAPCFFNFIHMIIPIKRFTYSSLAGITFSEKRPHFTIDSWISGKYQEQFTNWFNQRFGLREIFIRLNNQLYYILFDKSYMYNQSIIIGKQKQLYEREYIDDYTKHVVPMTFVQMNNLAEQIAEVQNLFKKHGVPFLVLITPNKAYTYPEYIPDAFFYNPISQQRNYDLILPLFDQHRINYIDGQRITLEAKKIVTYPLFCQGSTHWNYLGAYYTIVPLITKIEALTKKPIPRIQCSKVQLDTNPTGWDKDLASLLNLAILPTRYITPHPVFITTESKGSYENNIVFVGGSFTQTIIDILWENKMFNQIDYYYYYKINHSVYPKNKESSIYDVNNVNWNTDFLKKDAIVLEINEAQFNGNHIREFVKDALNRLR